MVSVASARVGKWGADRVYWVRPVVSIVCSLVGDGSCGHPTAGRADMSRVLVARPKSIGNPLNAPRSSEARLAQRATRSSSQPRSAGMRRAQSVFMLQRAAGAMTKSGT